MPHFLITAIGSYGDVHPMVGLGAALAERGHRVQVVTNPYFEDVVTGAGLELLPLGVRDDYIQLSQHPDLWHPIRGPKLVLQHACGPALRRLYDLVTSHYVAGETVLCAHGIDFASRIVGEKLRAPVAGIDFAPVMFWTVHDSPRLKGALLGPRVPKWAKRWQFTVSDALFVRLVVGPQLNGFRRELGLPPVRRLFGQWLHNTDLTIGLFPDWFGPPQPDWPPNVRLVGFPLWDSRGDTRLPDEVQQFLAAGSPPIAFSPGSANREASQFFAAAVEACERAGRRGILLTKYDHQLPAKLPDTVRHFGFLPLSKLLPHTVALVHHGGIGSCAQGLAAGVPHLVQPMSYDQFDNSRRLARLGVGREISVRHFRGPAVAASLELLLESAEVASRCQEWAARCDGPASLAAACVALEQLAETGTRLERSTAGSR